jgi:DNA-binding transcriptional ArsR family regulator
LTNIEAQGIISVIRDIAIKGNGTMDQQELLKAFKALSNESRLKLFEAIKNNQAQCSCCPENIAILEFESGGICCVDDIVGQFDMAQSTISQHLKELHNAGLLERHKKAQWVYYTVNRKRLDELAEYFQQLASELARKD